MNAKYLGIVLTDLMATYFVCIICIYRLFSRTSYQVYDLCTYCEVRMSSNFTLHKENYINSRNNVRGIT
jgi:uncharacterized CHY-type Zn-finger protein